MTESPFAGGGSIPLEAQRLGLEAHASDLNPVAVLINKAMIEIPPKFAGQPPVNPEARSRISAQGQWRGAQGLAEDVRYYGQWMRDEAFKRIGHLYPKVRLPKEQGGGEATVIAWLWARTVKCPNPACGAQMPLVRSFTLSTKAGKKAWVEPQIDRSQQPPKVEFKVRTGNGTPHEGTVGRRGAQCVVCGTNMPLDYVRTQGQANGLGAQLMAIVAEGHKGRIYLPPTEEQIAIAEQARPAWKPDAPLPDNTRDFRTQLYGLPTYGDLFTPRQLVALTTFSGLVGEARERVIQDARAAGLGDGAALDGGGVGAQAYGDAVATYLAFAVDRLADRNSTICSWDSSRDNVRNTFARQAIPMTWDFAEANPLSTSTGSFIGTVGGIVEVIELSQCPTHGMATQLDATSALNGVTEPLISTDPPYYDNIGYADLSDFFYVWMRRSLNKIYPSVLSTLLVPKAQELVATPYRFGGSREKAQHFFENGLGKAFGQMRATADPDYPLSVYYAFKQSEGDEEDDKDKGTSILASTGWETMLEGLLTSGFQITGTWPMRTELANRSIGIGTNALASSIVLVCRPRPADAPLTTRRDFINTLRREMPHALKQLQRGNIAPVDLAQAAIGPGMAVFSRYGKVLESDGEPMKVRTALQLINQSLDMVLAEQEGEYDRDTRWAVAWFDGRGHNEGPFGEADVLARAKNTSVQGLVESGFLEARGDKARLLRREELSEEWDPTTDKRLTVWEVTQHLIHALDKHGEGGAAAILRKVGGDYGETARDLAYRMYTTCERKKWAEEALAYNSLVVAWPQITQRASEIGGVETQAGFV